MRYILARRIFFGGSAVALLLLLLLLVSVLWATSVPSTVSLGILGSPQVVNGVLTVNIVISNETPRSLNIVDDAAGKPHFVLDAGAGDYPVGSGSHMVWLGSGAGGNTLKLNLASGASLTNTLNVASPPARFRLMVETRDFAQERRNWWFGPLKYMLPQRLSERLEERLERPRPASDWIEIKPANDRS